MDLDQTRAQFSATIFCSFVLSTASLHGNPLSVPRGAWAVSLPQNVLKMVLEMGMEFLLRVMRKFWN